MSIVSFGTATSEVETHLSLSAAIDTSDENGRRLTLLIPAVEDFIKTRVGRTFEEATYTNELHSVAPGDSRFFLSDRPVSAFTSIVRIDTYDSDGDPDETTTLDKDTYIKDLVRGVVHSRVGAFVAGTLNHRLTYTAGYSASDITNNADGEITKTKQLILSVIAQQFSLFGKGHLSSISFGDESPRYQFGLNRFQRDMVAQLSMGHHQI